jgi:hypothetical protein
MLNIIDNGNLFFTKSKVIIVDAEKDGGTMYTADYATKLSKDKLDLLNYW